MPKHRLPPKPLGPTHPHAPNRNPDCRTNRQQPRTNPPCPRRPSRLGPHRLRAQPLRQRPYSIRPLPSPSPPPQPATVKIRRPEHPPLPSHNLSRQPLKNHKSKRSGATSLPPAAPFRRKGGRLPPHTTARTSRGAQKSIRSVSGVHCAPGSKRPPAGVASSRASSFGWLPSTREPGLPQLPDRAQRVLGPPPAASATPG